MRIGVNGFGRMGGPSLRAAWVAPEVEPVRINETACDVAGSARLLQFDSVHDTWPREGRGEGGALTSADYVNDPRSSSVDALGTMVVDGTRVKLCAWYDNEWGHVSRLVDSVRMIGEGL